MDDEDDGRVFSGFLVPHLQSRIFLFVSAFQMYFGSIILSEFHTNAYSNALVSE